MSVHLSSTATSQLLSSLHTDRVLIGLSYLSIDSFYVLTSIPSSSSLLRSVIPCGLSSLGSYSSSTSSSSLCICHDGQEFSAL